MPVGDLDWMICNGGADIWQLLPEHDGKETTWVADEQWEAHISFRYGVPYLSGPVRRALPYHLKDAVDFAIQNTISGMSGRTITIREEYPRQLCPQEPCRVEALETPCSVHKHDLRSEHAWCQKRSW